MKIAIIVGLVVFFAVEYYSTPKVVYIEKEVVPNTKTFLVVDANYVDHEGDYESCVKYQEYFKDHHEYVVVEQVK